MLASLINIILIFGVLGVLITLHELGHFLAAKLSKVQVDEFAVGMGPAIMSKSFRGTKYSLRALPIGGYVKILGEGDDPDQDLQKLKEHPGNFQNKHPFTKIFILSAGVVMNLLTAVLIYYGFLLMSDFSFLAPPIDNYKPVIGELQREKITDAIGYELAESGKARDAGWPEEGFILSINDAVLEYSDQFSEYVNNSPGGSFIATICTDEALTDCQQYETDVSQQGIVGILLSTNYLEVIEYEGMAKALAGFSHSINVVHMGVANLSQVFSEASDTGDYDTAVNSVSSPIGLYFVVDFLRSFGLVGMLDLIANLSVTLFIMNLLPIPALDGGRIVLVLTEWGLGDLYNKAIEAWAIRISFILLMVFMLVIIIKDIVYWDRLAEIFG